MGTCVAYVCVMFIRLLGLPKVALQANVFVNNEKRAVIADYELGQVIEYRKNFTTIKPAGPTRWTAPELTSHTGDDEDDGPHFTAATDIFAFAMTVIEV